MVVHESWATFTIQPKININVFKKKTKLESYYNGGLMQGREELIRENINKKGCSMYETFV